MSDNFAAGGLDIYVSIKGDHTRRQLLRLDGPGRAWEEIDPATLAPATLTLPEEAARALLDALLRHYQGASDMHTVRADLLHERSRVDKLTDTLIELAVAGMIRLGA